MYNEPSKKVAKNKSTKIEEGSALRGVAAIGAGTAAATGGRVNANKLVKNKEELAEEEDDFEEPQLSIIGALIALAISTTLVAFCSEFMVSSINGLTADGRISTTFVGLILLPIVGNAAEHATAVTVAIKDKMDLAIGVAVGSSMQIALLVLPFIVVLGWILGKECMTLFFDTFQVAVLFVAVLLVNYLIQDGKSRKINPYSGSGCQLTRRRLARRCPSNVVLYHHSARCLVLPQYLQGSVLVTHSQSRFFTEWRFLCVYPMAFWCLDPPYVRSVPSNWLPRPWFPMFTN